MLLLHVCLLFGASQKPSANMLQISVKFYMFSYYANRTYMYILHDKYQMGY